VQEQVCGFCSKDSGYLGLLGGYAYSEISKEIWNKLVILHDLGTSEKRHLNYFTKFPLPMWGSENWQQP
jgi:hypothetical protein